MTYAIEWWSPIAFLWHDAAIRAAVRRRRTSRRVRAGVRLPLRDDRFLHRAQRPGDARPLDAADLDDVARRARSAVGFDPLYATWDNLLLSDDRRRGRDRCADHWRPRKGRPAKQRDFAPRASSSASPCSCCSCSRFSGRPPHHTSTRAVSSATRGRRWRSRPCPERAASTVDDAWTTSGFEETADAQLDRFRGAAAGRNVVMVSLESTAAKYSASTARPPIRCRTSRRWRITASSSTRRTPSIRKHQGSLLDPLFQLPRARQAGRVSYVDAPCASIADVLGRRGYRAALFHSGRFGYLGMEAVVRGRGYGVLEDAGDIGGQHESASASTRPSTVAPDPAVDRQRHCFTGFGIWDSGDVALHESRV